MENKYIYTIIKSAVNKGIDYISDNPKRGIRNILDLGEYFASGRFQKEFFNIAHEILNKEDSFYYDKIEDLVANTNHESIAEFGINLGYNSFTYGAGKLREYENKQNYRVPWTLVFDFRKKSEDHLSKDEISDIFNKAKSYGIYCFIILLDDNDILMQLHPLIEYNQDSAFLLILSHESITEKTVGKMKSLNNLCFFILLNDSEQNEFKSSVDNLRNEKCLYGGAYYYDNDTFTNITKGNWFKEKISFILYFILY